MIYFKEKISICTFFVLLLSGCDFHYDANRFQIASSSSGDVYRIQSSTGAIYKISGGNLIRIQETNRVQLQVGAVYVFEDGENMVYLGKGNFKTLKSNVLTADEWLKNDNEK